MPRYAVAIVLGCLLAFYGNELPDQFWSAFAPMFLLLGFYCRRYRFALWFVAAYLWSSAAFHYHFEHRLVSGYDQQVTLLRGQVTGIPEVSRGKIRLYLQLQEISGYSASLPRRLRLAWYQDEIVPGSGEHWQFLVKLRQPRGALNFAGFDFEAWQFSRGIDATGYVRNSTMNRMLEPASSLNLHRVRNNIAREIDLNCVDCVHRGLIKALSLGFRGDIESGQRNLLQSTGTAHLLAISGLHIGMLSFLFYAFGRYCWRPVFYRFGLKRVQLASISAIIAALGYAALAGFGLPTVRALVMLCVFLCALQFKSRINLLQSIALAVIVILLLDPRAIGSASFWLSFGALLVIAYAQSLLPSRLPWWQQLFLLQCFFTLLLMPVGVLIFGQFNPAGFFANIIAIPMVSFLILPLVLTGCLLIPLGAGVATACFKIADMMLGYLFDYLRLLTDSGLQSIAVDYPVPLVLLALVSALSILLPAIPGGRKIALVAPIVMVCWQPVRLEHGDFELVVMDIGMGTSLLLRTRNHSLVYDLGPGRPGAFNPVDWALKPLLLRHQIDQPDLLVISHVDQDHSGGLNSFHGYYHPARLLTGMPQALKARFSLTNDPRSCHAYPDWRWDGVDFSFLDAGEQAEKTSSNNRSCILSVQGHHRVLIPGDIESSQESRLLKLHAAALDTDILLAPHHGSNTSSSWPFVLQARPGYVVYTQSRGNRWGFPRAEVVARYEAIAARQFRNDRDGAISLVSSPEGLLVTTLRKPVRRIWRRW